jgi:hypothetical protein
LWEEGLGEAVEDEAIAIGETELLKDDVVAREGDWEAPLLIGGASLGRLGGGASEVFV